MATEFSSSLNSLKVAKCSKFPEIGKPHQVHEHLAFLPRFFYWVYSILFLFLSKNGKFDASEVAKTCRES